MMKRTNLWLDEDEVRKAQEILREKQKLSLSGWVSLQLRKLIRQHGDKAKK